MLADQQERRVPHQPFDLVLLRVFVATRDPEALLGDLRTELAGKVFRHACRDVVALPRVFEPRRIDHHQMRRLDFRGHLGELEGDGLVVGDRLAERLPLLHRHLALEGADTDEEARADTVTWPTSIPPIIWKKPAPGLPSTSALARCSCRR